MASALTLTMTTTSCGDSSTIEFKAAIALANMRCPIDLGDGYELTYGQLFDISTEVGETLQEGDRIAMVAYPTRSYMEEGENLYLKLTKDGTAVNPEFYLKK